MDADTPKSPGGFRKTYLREWRKHRKLTQKQLAEMSSIEESMISMLERGDRGYVQRTMESLAAALETTVAALIMRPPGPEDEKDPLITFLAQASPEDRVKIQSVAEIVIGRKLQ